MMKLNPRQLAFALSILAAAAFLVQVWANIESIESYYGTARAPHSDALVPWLQGTLSYYFHDVPTALLYRPTVGIIYDSLLSSFWTLRIHWLPAFFAAFLLAVLVVYFLISRPLVAAPVALWLLFAAAHYDQVVTLLDVGTLNVDFLSFVLTFTGVLFLVLAFSHRPASLAAASVAFLLLGMSAAIRGPLMFAGPALLAGAAFLLYRNRQALGILLLVVCFCLPLLVDGAVRKVHSIETNGANVAFAFYSDPRHTWTASTEAVYQQLKPPKREVLSNYLAFVSSPEGMAVVFRFFLRQLHADAFRMVSLPGIGVLVVALLCARFLPQNNDASPPARDPLTAETVRRMLRDRDVLVRYVVPITLLLLVAVIPAIGGVIALLLLFWLLIVSLRMQLHFAAACIVLYTLALLFLSLLGLAWVPRLSLTMSFCLPLGFYFFLVQPPAETTIPPTRPLFVSSLLTAMLLAWIYAGGFVLAPPAKRLFKEQVEGRSAAIKISADPRLDRSLYYTGAKQLLYTRFDSAPVASVLQFESVTTPTGEVPDSSAAASNASFLAPVTFKAVP